MKSGPNSHIGSSFNEWLIDENLYDKVTKSALVILYKNLLEKQQLLGKEFEKVLYDNLWDLYVRS
jgi:hypothetical protein